jgi:hypothetical protein
MAGIIDIALKSSVDLGLSGGVNCAVSTPDRCNSSGNLGYRSGRWTSFVSAGLVSDRRTAVGVNDRERYDASSALQSITAQDILLSPRMHGQNLNATVDYKLSARDVLSNALLLNHRASGEASTTTQTLLDGAGGTIDRYVRPRHTDAEGSMLAYDVALERTFTPRAHELSTELRFNRAHDEDVYDERRLAGADYVNGRIDRDDALTRQLTAQVDYLKALRPRTKLETGWKSTARWLDRDYVVTTDAGSRQPWPAPRVHRRLRARADEDRGERDAAAVTVLPAHQRHHPHRPRRRHARRPRGDVHQLPESRGRPVSGLGPDRPAPPLAAVHRSHQRQPVQDGDGRRLHDRGRLRRGGLDGPGQRDVGADEDPHRPGGVQLPRAAVARAGVPARPPRLGSLHTRAHSTRHTE